MNPSIGLVFRARNYFRKAENPFETEAQTFAPLSVEYRLEDPSSADPSWATHVWTLLFSDGRNEMMLLFELFFNAETRARAEAVRPHVDAAAPHVRYIPGQWDMEPEE